MANIIPVILAGGSGTRLWALGKKFGYRTRLNPADQRRHRRPFRRCLCSGAGPRFRRRRF